MVPIRREKEYYYKESLFAAGSCGEELDWSGEFINKLKRQEQTAAPQPEPAPSKEEQLLTEIRDLLKEKK